MELGLKQVSRAVSVLEGASSSLRQKILSATLSLPSAVALAVHYQSVNGKCEIQNRLLQEAISCVEKGAATPLAGSQFKKQRREFYLVKSEQDLLSTQFDYFCDRFRRSIANGSRDEGYKDLREAFYEMTDNVVCHSGSEYGRPVMGVVAYEVSDWGGCFTVCDSGCGFVESLHRSERWRSINSHKEAIAAVVLNGATCRPNETTGGGFKGLFASLVELNSTTLLRSGDCLASIAATSAGQELEFQASPSLDGAQITVLFSLKGPPEEKFH